MRTGLARLLFLCSSIVLGLRASLLSVYCSFAIVLFVQKEYGSWWVRWLMFSKPSSLAEKRKPTTDMIESGWLEVVNYLLEISEL